MSKMFKALSLPARVATIFLATAAPVVEAASLIIPQGSDGLGYDFAATVHDDFIAVRYLSRRQPISEAQEADEARSFAARLKHRQGKSYARRKSHFRRQQASLAQKRHAMKLKRAKAKAQQFAIARQHAQKKPGKRRGPPVRYPLK